jgi:flagellar biosynthesis/type III secretory pathway M-ring protein FliF/YscJ
MKRKMLPIILMLTAGAVTSIITFVKDYELTKMLWLLLVTLIVFYLIGVGIKKVLDVFDEQIEASREQESEGAVIEKELQEEDEQSKEHAEETVAE